MGALAHRVSVGHEPVAQAQEGADHLLRRSLKRHAACRSTPRTRARNRVARLTPATSARGFALVCAPWPTRRARGVDDEALEATNLESAQRTIMVNTFSTQHRFVRS